RYARQRTDFLLGDLQVTVEIGIEDRIEQRRDRARQPRGDIKYAAIFDQADELAKPLVELHDQKTVKGYAVLIQPEEGALIHQRDTGVAECHHVVTPCLFLQHSPLAEPRPRREAGDRK